MPADLDLVRRLAAADHGLAVFTTTRRDGSVQASLVNAGVLANPVSSLPAVGVVVRADAHKLKLLRAIFSAAGGTHDDWDEFDRVMAAERRTAVFVEPVRITSNG